MSQALLITVIGLLGMAVVYRFRKCRYADITACAWSILSYHFLSYFLNGIFVKGNAEGWQHTSIFPPALVTFISLAAFLWIGLIKLWPIREPLGFFRRRASWSLLLGVAVGCLFATMFFPRIWFGMATFHIYSVLIPFASCVIASSVVEECIFRGRLMDVLSDRIVSTNVVFLVQASLFVMIHVHSLVRHSSPTRIIGELAIIFALGWVLGYLRRECRNLWAPVGAHVVYNLLFAVSLVCL